MRARSGETRAVCGARLRYAQFYRALRSRSPTPAQPGARPSPSRQPLQFDVNRRENEPSMSNTTPAAPPRHRREGIHREQLRSPAAAERPGCEVVNLDLLTYAGNPENLTDVVEDAEAEGRYRFVRGDIADPEVMAELFRRAGSTRSCTSRRRATWTAPSPAPGPSSGPTWWAPRPPGGRPRARRQALPPRLHRRGVRRARADEPAFTERRRFRPSSPYSASKAGSDHLALA